MKELLRHIGAMVMFIVWMTSCINNDIPYPYIPAEFQEFAVEGQVGEAQIDPGKRSINITIDEWAELDSLRVIKVVATKEATIYPDSSACKDRKKFPDFSFTTLDDLPKNANTLMNFTHPVKFLLKTYQDYWWTVVVKQEIKRTIEVENQVGDPIIDVKNRIALIYVSNSQSLKEISIKKLELEGSNCKLLPDPATVTNFFRPQEFAVYRRNKYIGLWTVDVQQTQVVSSTGAVEVWGKKAVVNGGVRVGAVPVIEYKQATEGVWKQLSASAVTMPSATTFRGTITGLQDGTTYDWRVVVDGTPGEPASFITEKIQEVPNLNFDTWTQSGKNWFANSVADDYNGEGAYWATGNEGVTSALAGSNAPITVPVEGSAAYRGKAAQMTTITGVPLVGAAAGNLFIGKYKTNMQNPSKSVEFGRPFTGARPTKLTGYYKYTPQPISNGGTVPGTLTSDECHIYVKIWDASGNQFGYGELIGKEKVTAYTKFTIQIQYNNMSVKPASIAIVATSSRYGGEFSGAKVVGQVGAGSILFVDEFELLYE